MLCFTFFTAEEITFESFLLLEDATLASLGIKAGPRLQILSLVKTVCAVEFHTSVYKNVDLLLMQAAYCFKFKTASPSFQICSWSF